MGVGCKNYGGDFDSLWFCMEMNYSWPNLGPHLNGFNLYVMGKKYTALFTLCYCCSVCFVFVFVLFFVFFVFTTLHKATDWVFHILDGSAMFGATFNLITRVGLPYFLQHRNRVVWKWIVYHQIILSATETSNKMASTLCQKMVLK